MKRLIAIALLFECVVSLRVGAQTLDPALELETFLRTQKNLQKGVFTITASSVDDEDDDYKTFNAELQWDLNPASFSLKLYSNSEPKKLEGTFEFSLKEGFRFTDTQAKITKSDTLNAFYRKFFNRDGTLDLGKAFKIKRKAIMEESKLIHYQFDLDPKGTIKNLQLKNIQLNMKPDLKTVLLLKFRIANKIYVWSSPTTFYDP